MQRIAKTTAPHPITGSLAALEIFDFGDDTVMRCHLTEREGIDTIIYAGKHPDAVMRETGLFWHVDPSDAPAVEIPAIASAEIPAAPPHRAAAVVTVYDDGTGRALLQRVDVGPPNLTVTWKSPGSTVAAWIEENSEFEWRNIAPQDPGEERPPEPDADGYTVDPDHVHFEAKKLSIGWAVTYQDAPRSKAIDGGTRTRRSLRFPVLVAGEFVDDAEDVCKAAAAILERNKAEMGAK